MKPLKLGFLWCQETMVAASALSTTGLKKLRLSLNCAQEHATGHQHQQTPNQASGVDLGQCCLFQQVRGSLPVLFQNRPCFTPAAGQSIPVF